jgi:2-polyprenyl-3-methyl-5-hydroxy-6-metoxy-1,4-benzoquinol methylase
MGLSFVMLGAGRAKVNHTGIQDPSGSLSLLPEQALLATSGVDHAEWNYRPVLGRIQRLRFELVRSILRGPHATRLLEIGYGSGVFFPELAKHADQLHGVDPHPFPVEVTHVLAQHGVKANLVQGIATELPFADGFFQTVVAVSVLEFIDDLAKVCREVKRVLEPGGSFVIVTPANSPILDLGVRVMTGVSPKSDFRNRRQGILPCLYHEFVVDQRVDYPSFAHGARLYTALRLCAPPKS